MRHLSLFELNKLVKQTLDANLEPSYWVIAEISEKRLNQTGHCYLELVEKDDDKVIAKMRATIWSYTYRNLSAWFEGITGEALQPGLKVLCNVTIQYHELYGMSLNIRDIDANYTLGERARKRKQILDQLVADGVYEMNKLHQLPIVPQRIAVISSPTAAGFGDFADQIEKNAHGYKFEIRLFKAVMQGEKACESIINAMMQVHSLQEHFDALVIIRGGGSQIDLDCFDDYDLASHIAQFSLPVITGIGHERDETIADLVAHTMMKTPTAVAEFLISGVRSYEEKLDNQFARIQHYASAIINQQSQKLSTLTYKLKHHTKDIVARRAHKLENLSGKLRLHCHQRLAKIERQLDLAEKSVDLLKPETILKRGYTITTVNGKTVGNIDTKVGDILRTESIDKILYSKIEKQEVKK